MAASLPRQDLRRSAGGLRDNQTVELSLAARLEAYRPMAGEPVEAMAWDPIGAEGIE